MDTTAFAARLRRTLFVASLPCFLVLGEEAAHAQNVTFGGSASTPEGANASGNAAAGAAVPAAEAAPARGRRGADRLGQGMGRA